MKILEALIRVLGFFLFTAVIIAGLNYIAVGKGVDAWTYGAVAAGVTGDVLIIWWKKR